MLSFLNKHSMALLLVLSMFLMGQANDGQGTDGQSIVEQQKQLSAKVEALKVEQDYLLFQKAMYASDSKYLVVNVTARTGQLKYKNRVLRDFGFKVLPGKAVMPAQGAIALTKKIEGAKGRNALIFGTALMLQDTRSPAERIGARVRFALRKKDFLSIFYAVETGAKAYIIR